MQWTHNIKGCWGFQLIWLCIQWQHLKAWGSVGHSAFRVQRQNFQIRCCYILVFFWHKATVGRRIMLKQWAQKTTRMNRDLWRKEIIFFLLVYRIDFTWCWKEHSLLHASSHTSRWCVILITGWWESSWRIRRIGRRARSSRNFKEGRIARVHADTICFIGLIGGHTYGSWDEIQTTFGICQPIVTDSVDVMQLWSKSSCRGTRGW